MTVDYSIDVNPAGSLARIAKWIEKLPSGARDLASQTIAESVVNYMRMYEDYAYISRAQAYPDAPAGPGWFSDRQRRYVMAKIRSGEIQIPYPRTMTLQAGWQVRSEGNGNYKISNIARYAQYVQGDGTQSRHEAMVGWKTVSQKIDDNQNRIMADARNAVRAAIRRLARELGETYG